MNMKCIHNCIFTTHEHQHQHEHEHRLTTNIYTIWSLKAKHMNMNMNMNQGIHNCIFKLHIKVGKIQIYRYGLLKLNI